MKKYLLAGIVFASGAVVMIFEIVGSRVLAPYIGTSLFVWTSLIGVILGSLSLGYWLGGKCADRRADFKILSFILFVAALGIIFVVLIKDVLLTGVQNSTLGLKASAILSSLALFTIPSAMLGTISPVAARIKITTLQTSGSAVGNLYAISTIGSIVGTFLAGFVLIPHLGTVELLLVLAATLLIISVISFQQHFVKSRIVTLFLLVLLFSANRWGIAAMAQQGIVVRETPYYSVRIYETTDDTTGKSIREMRLNYGRNSAMFLDGDDELVYEYTKYYRLARHFVPEHPGVERALMLGGAGYSFPKVFLREWPQAQLDVVEIDSVLTDLARQYFRLPNDPRLHIVHADGRTFINTVYSAGVADSTGHTAAKKYDVIFGDAFNSTNGVPYELITQEAVRRYWDILDDDGVMIVNIISALEGEGGEFASAAYATFTSVFTQVYLFPVSAPQEPAQVQNLILVALKSAQVPKWNNADPELQAYLQHLYQPSEPITGQILTDNFAPVDYYISKFLK